MTAIGIMQGRLLPAIDGRIQAFPWACWTQEFDTAREMGFDLVEFIFEGPSEATHPLMTEEGRSRILERIDATGVRVGSVCADYFMEHPLHRGDTAARARSVDVLRRLVEGAAAVGAVAVEIPCVDHASLDGSREEDALCTSLADIPQTSLEQHVRILLETDLPPLRFSRLLQRLDGHVGANYDTGNSASLGYDPVAEVRVLAPWIKNVHVKDRVLGGTTVPLGQGAAQFDAFFAALGDAGYEGPLVLQTARDPDDLGVARRYLAMVKSWARNHLGKAR